MATMRFKKAFIYIVLMIIYIFSHISPVQPQTKAKVITNQPYIAFPFGTSAGTPRTVIADINDVTIDVAKGMTPMEFEAIMYSSKDTPFSPAFFFRD